MDDLRPQWNEEAVGANHPTKDDVINRAWNVEHEMDGTHKVLYTSVMPKVNAAVNKLDIFAKSSGALPDATHIISDLIPDGSGATWRYRAGAVAGGNGQIILADGQNYWGKGSLNGEIKTAWLYAIWSAADAGIVWALGGYSGFTKVPTTTTVTDDDYFLLEDGSTYTRAATDYCVAVARIRYEYDTADTPDHTIQATVENGPQYIWNPKSDYGYTIALAADSTSGSDIPSSSFGSVIVKQSGIYLIMENISGLCAGGGINITAYIKTGSSTYASAVGKAVATQSGAVTTMMSVPAQVIVPLNAGDYIHMGASLAGTSGNRTLAGKSSGYNFTSLSFERIG